MTRYLLDTCTLIWLYTEPERVPATATEAIDAADSVLLWSDAEGVRSL